MSRKVREHELMEYCSKLEQIMDRPGDDQSKRAADLMKVLATLNIDPMLLRSAQIILTVNDLRQKLDDKEVVRLSKELLTTWRAQVVEELHQIRDILINGFNKKTKIPQMSRKSKYINEYKRRLSADTNEENRIKSREMIAKALMADKVIAEDILKMADIAVQMETAIFDEFKKIDRKYLTRIRSRVANLGDEDRSDLRAQVLNGIITPEEMATMTAQDMASDRLKKLRERFTKESMKENILPEVYGTTSDLLRCPECKQNTCTYNQVQIERADEPMTTFCLCITCGHRWRFN